MQATQRRRGTGRIHVSDKHGVNPAVPRCFYCLENKNEVILAGKLPGDKEAPQSAVWDNVPCDSCAELMTQGVILVSVRDDQLEELEWAQREKRMPNPYRTGGFWVLKDEAIRRIITPEELAEQIIKHRFTFVPDEVALALGLFDAEESDGKEDSTAADEEDSATETETND